MGARELLTPDNLRQYQWKAIRFLQGHEHAALFLDMGLGKTVSALSLIKSLLLLPQAGVRTWLCVAPLRVVRGVWRQEATKWSHTRDIVFSVVHGNELQRRQALDTPAHVYLINPEGLVWLMEMLRRLGLDNKDAWPFDGLLIDESSMFKSPETKRWKALAQVLHLFKRRIIMTGTPTPNNLMEIWPQMYLLDMGERLGTTFIRFRERFFMREEFAEINGRTVATRWGPRPGAQRYIERTIGDIVLRLDAKDWLDLPPLIGLARDMGGPCDVIVDLPDHARRLYDELEEEMFIELETADVEAISAAALSGKCHQLANGAIYGDERGEDDLPSGRRVWEPVHDAKLDALEEIVDECGGPIIVAYQFQHDLERLRAKFPTFAVVQDLHIEDFEQDWNRGRYPGALMHPKSAGHGLNLQDGGRNLAFFSLTWSTEQIDQIVARIGPTRQAQAGRTEPVKAYRIIARGTVDEAIVSSNGFKQHTQRALLNALKEYRNAKNARR